MKKRNKKEKGMTEKEIDQAETIDSIGTKIYKLRKENHLTQEALARAIYVTDGTISKWENGYSSPDYGYLKAMAKVFHVKASYFLEDNSVKTKFKMFWRGTIQFLKTNYKKIFTILLFLFLGFYFLNTYDKLALYRIVSTDENLTFEYGYYTRSKTNLFISINNINYTSDENDIVSQKLKLYYLKAEDKKYIYESNNLEDVYYREAIGYNVTKDAAKHLDKNLYLEIENIHEDNSTTSYSIKLQFKLYIASDRLFYQEKMTYYESNESSNNTVTIYNLLHNKYNQVENSDTYYKDFKDYRLYFDLTSNCMFYTNSSKNTIEEIRYFYSNKYLTYHKNVNSSTIGDFHYYFDSNYVECKSGDCNNYLEIYKDAKSKFDAAFA